ncbi:MAG TPA: VWA domain-containing protein [Pyrinomonadaceae bacterium]
MNVSNESHAKAQSRKVSFIKLSLRLFARCGLCAVVFLTLFIVPSASAQEAAETIRVRTRVVFMDALVKDKQTGIAISDLKPENFEVFDDGQPRTISYFTREGQARKPLAIVMILDLRDDGAGRFLKREEVRKAIVEELAKLPPGDEVAILAINLNSVDDKTAAIRNGKAMWLTEFTRDPAQFEAALARIPALVAPAPETGETDASKHDQKNPAREGSASVMVNSDADKNATKDSSEAKSKDNDVLETETIKGKNGAVITRTIRKDGSVNVKRVSTDGKVAIQLDNIYDMAGATRDATHLADEKRPNSQAAIIWLSDGIAPIFYEDRDATEQILLRQNAIFNTLTVDMRTLYKFLLPFGQPLIGWTGLSLAGSAKRLAQQSGGEAVHIGRVSDYGAGLAKIIGNLTARYSLGFALSEQEKDDGRMHELAVRVKALDAKGKQRKLDVSSRRGYYMPKGDTDQAAANK